MIHPKKERIGRKPRTGEKVIIAPRRIVFFKQAQSLKLSWIHFFRQRYFKKALFQAGFKGCLTQKSVDGGNADFASTDFWSLAEIFYPQEIFSPLLLTSICRKNRNFALKIELKRRFSRQWTFKNSLFQAGYRRWLAQKSVDGGNADFAPRT